MSRQHERRTDGVVVAGRRARHPQLEPLETRTLLATIVVTGTGDTIADDGVVTLREAITAANTNAASGDAPAGQAGLDTIAFNIPDAGVQTIRPLSDLPTITEPATIDGYTQPGARPNTNPITAGSNANLLIELTPNDPIYSSTTGLRISAGNSTVRGLAINRFQTGLILEAGGGDTIAGNDLGTDPTGTKAQGNETNVSVQSPNNTIGGTAPADRNVISGATSMGIYVRNFNTPDLASGTVIQGNFIGTDVTGTRALPNLIGLQIFGVSNATIGGTAAGARNLISGNTLNGIELEAHGSVIQGNFIGTDVTGTTKLGNSGFGLHEDGGRNNTIGGTGAGAGNVISGNGAGLAIDRSIGDRVQGNLIGTDVTGLLPLGNTADGVYFEYDGDYSDIMIGGTVAGSGNTIAFNRAAINLAFDPVTILGNSIYGNGHGTVAWVATYDGPNPPELTSVAGMSIAGTFRNPANSTFRLEFFATPNERDQGKTFLGATDVTTDAAGYASFTFSPPGGVPAGQFLTATATDNTGTSTFSQAITIPAGTAADLAVTVSAAPNPVAAGGDLTYTITVTNNGPNAAQAPALTSAVPAGTTFVSFTAPAGWTATIPAAGGTGTVSATAASLNANDGGPVNFTLVVHVSPGVAGGSVLSLSARVATTTADPTTANNSDAEATTVSVAPPSNAAPTAAADAYTAITGATLTVPSRGVLVNDTDPEGNPLAVVLETPPAHGVLALAADGSFTYTPATGFSGADTFTYRASDGLLTSAPSTVTLDVAAAPPSGDTIGPRVTALRRFGFHAQPTFLVASFDAALDAAAASNPNHYRLVDLGPARRRGPRDARARSVQVRDLRRRDPHGDASAAAFGAGVASPVRTADCRGGRRREPYERTGEHRTFRPVVARGPCPRP